MYMILTVLAVDFIVALWSIGLAGVTIPVTLPPHNPPYPFQEHYLFIGGWVALVVGWAGVLWVTSWVIPASSWTYAPTCMLAIAALAAASLVAIKANRESFLGYRKPQWEYKTKEAAV